MKNKGGKPFTQSHEEKNQPMAPCSVPKYTTIPNPADQDKARSGLADYAKKNKMKY